MLLLVLPTNDTDDRILAELQRGNAQAVDAVYETYFAPLYNFTRLKVGDAALAEDIVGEVFVQLMRVLGTPAAPRTHLRGWLFRVARNQIAAHYDRSRQITLTELEDWMPAKTENPEDLALTSIEVERVRAAIRTLSEDYQEVLILRLGQRLTLRETADIMGRSVAAVKSLQFRALDHLRNLLKEGHTNG